MADERRWPLVWSPLSPEEMKAKGEWPPKPGTVYGAPWLLRPASVFASDLNACWRDPASSPKRPPLIVWLPGGAAAWCLDHKAPDGTRWEFDEPRPDEPMESWVQRLTVTPSINAVGCYHGFIRNGALTPDVDGRNP